MEKLKSHTPSIAVELIDTQSFALFFSHLVLCPKVKLKKNYIEMKHDYQPRPGKSNRREWRMQSASK